MINSAFVFLILLVFAIFIIILNLDKIRLKLFSKKEEETYVKICPKCGSTKIIVDFSNPAVWAAGTPPKYICLYCKRISFIFPDIIVENIDSYRNRLKQLKKYGNFSSKNNDLIDASSGYILGMFDYVYLTAITLLTIFVFFIFYFISNYYFK